MIGVAYLGGIIAFAGTIWIVILAVQDEEYFWAIGSFCCGFVALAYGIMKFDEAKIALVLLVVGWIIGVIGQIGAAGTAMQ